MKTKKRAKTVGRRPLREGEQTVTTSLKVTEGQLAKLKRLGGGAWVRRKIDEARDPE